MNAGTELRRVQELAPHTAPDLEGLHRRRERRARRSRIGTIALALAIGVASVGGAWLAFHDGGTERRPAAGSHLGPPVADLTLGDGDYYLLQVHVVYDAPHSTATTPHQEGTYRTWWATDGSGRSANLEGHWTDDGMFDAGEFRSDTGPVGNLSTDPVQLEAQLRQRVEPDGASPEPYADWGGPVEWGLVRSIQELLLAPDLAPAQKAALVRVAANLDGVTTVEDTVDPEGRAAIELTTHTEQKLTEWWFDPQSLQLLTARETYDEGGPLTTTVVEAAGVARSRDTDRLVRSFVRTLG